MINVFYSKYHYLLYFKIDTQEQETLKTPFVAPLDTEQTEKLKKETV